MSWSPEQMLETAPNTQSTVNIKEIEQVKCWTHRTHIHCMHCIRHYKQQTPNNKLPTLNHVKKLLIAAKYRAMAYVSTFVIESNVVRQKYGQLKNYKIYC